MTDDMGEQNQLSRTRARCEAREVVDLLSQPFTLLADPTHSRGTPFLLGSAGVANFSTISAYISTYTEEAGDKRVKGLG